MLARARIERELYKRLALESGLARLIELHPDISQEEYERYSRLLVNGDPAIRNISVIEDTTIVMVYPYEQNKTALGRDLSEIPDQREAILQAKETGKTVITGPVNLVQGGTGIVTRMPIRLYAPDGSQTYWGQVGLVIDLTNLLKLAETFSDSSIRVMLVDSINPAIGVFAGDPGVAAENPVSLSVSVPDSAWEIAGVPVSGWKAYRKEYLITVLCSALISLVIALLVALVVATRIRMRDLAFFDSLTTLPNRKLYWDRFGVSVAFAARRQLRIAVFVLDLDGFKDVNDRYGHNAGDRLLRQVAERLSSSVRADDTLARVGGDEFALHAVMAEGENTISRVAERIESVFAEPFSEPENGMRIGVSYGYAVWPIEGKDGESVYEKADHRMYLMKKARGHRS